MKLFDTRSDLLSTLPPIDLYSDPAFLAVVADVYHAGKACRVRDYVVEGEVYRLLEVEGQGPLVSQRFIDLHEPLGRLPASGPRLRTLARLPNVARPLERLAEFQQRPDQQALEGAPTVQWSDFATWADYLALLQSRHVLSEDRRRGRRLREQVGEVAFAAHDDAEDVLPTCFEWKSLRDVSLGRESAFSYPVHQRFFHELKARGMLRASTLRGGDGRLLSIWLGAVHGAHWSGWIFTFNPAPELSRFSLGLQLLYPMLEESYRAGHAEFDFSIGLEPYKLKFATHVRPIETAGSPAPMHRAADAARGLLAKYPTLYARARALRRRLSTQAPATAMSAGEP